MQTSGNFSWLFSQITKAFSSVPSKTMSLEFNNYHLPMNHDQFQLNLSDLAMDIPFIKTFLAFKDLFTLIPQINYIISQDEMCLSISDDQKIGAGGNAQVFLANDYINNITLAMKIVDDVDFNRQESSINECINQFTLQKMNKDLILNIKNLVFINFANQKAAIQIPLELADFSLFDYIQKNAISIESYNYFFNLFIDMLILLHSNDYAHRDIKPHNILFVKNQGWKLADFGESLQYQERKGLYKIQGTVAFMPRSVRQQISKNKEIIQDLFYNDIYSIVSTLVLIKNPHLSSSSLIERIESGNFDEYCLNLIKLNDPSELKELKFHYNSKNIIEFSLNNENIQNQTEFHLDYHLLILYQYQIPIHEQVISLIYEFLPKNLETGQSQVLILALILLHPFQLNLFNLKIRLNQNLRQNIFNCLIETGNKIFLHLYLRIIQSSYLLIGFIQFLIEKQQIKTLLSVIQEYQFEFPHELLLRLLDLLGKMIINDESSVDSKTIYHYKVCYNKVFGSFSKNYQESQSLNQSTVEVFNYDEYFEKNKQYILDYKRLNLRLLFSPLVDYKLDQIIKDKVMSQIILYLRSTTTSNDKNSQDLVTILKYQLIKGGCKQYMNSIGLVIDGVQKLFLHYDLFNELLTILEYFLTFIVFFDTKVRLRLIITIQNLMLKLNYPLNLSFDQLQFDNYKSEDKWIEFSDRIKYQAYKFTISVQQNLMYENSKQNKKPENSIGLGITLFDLLNEFIQQPDIIVYQFDELIESMFYIVNVLREQQENSNYMRILILILIKYLYNNNDDSTKFMIEEQRFQFDQILFQSYFKWNQYQRITQLIRLWSQDKNVRIFNKGNINLIAKTKLMKRNLSFQMESSIFYQVIILFVTNEVNRYFFNFSQHLNAIRNYPNLKKRIKTDNLSLRNQYTCQ